MMKLAGTRISKVVLFVLVFAFLTLNARDAAACTCGGQDSPCEAYASADAVLIGTVGEVENEMAKGEDGREYVAGQRARVQVEKVFKGLKETEVIFRSHASTCDSVYEEGQRWLFYAYYDKEDKSWEIHACDRSTLIEYAADDLLYLQALPASAGKTRISGTLTHYEDDPVKGFYRVKSLIGVKVKITGEGKTYEVYTDKNGVYEIYGLPAGSYAIEPEPSIGLKLRFPMYFGEVDFSDKSISKALLTAKSCAGANFLYSSDTSISGKVFGADGRALPLVGLSLMPKDQPVAGNWNVAFTDEQGRYRIDKIPPGEYVIVVNDDGKLSAHEPFTTAYYPGVFDRKKATVLAITAGASLKDYDIHIPSQEATRVIQGVLLYSDGRPVAHGFVEFNAEKAGENVESVARVGTDSQGRFSVRLLQGLSGELHGFMYVDDGKFAKCPELDKLIEERGESAHDIKTKPIKLEIDHDMEAVKLVLPFPYCAEVERN